MRMRHHVILSTVIALIALPVLAASQSLPYPTDAQTGRAVGAKRDGRGRTEAREIDAGERVLVIEVVIVFIKEMIPCYSYSVCQLAGGFEGYPQGPDARVHVRDGEAKLAGCEAGGGAGLHDGRFCPIRSWKGRATRRSPEEAVVSDGTVARV